MQRRSKVVTKQLQYARFRYWSDPLCCVSLCVYWINREWIKPTAWGHQGFFHDYLNDVLLIPLFLPPTLLLQWALRLRRHQRAPSILEVFSHWAIWSFLFLYIFPHIHWLYRHSTADP